MGNSCHSSSWQVKAGGSGVEDQPWLHSAFKASLGIQEICLGRGGRAGACRPIETPPKAIKQGKTALTNLKQIHREQFLKGSGPVSQVNLPSNCHLVGHGIMTENLNS